MSSTPAPIDMAEFLEMFFEEAEEHLSAFEGGLLELEAAPSDAEVIARVFRAAHSLKGGSAIVGLHDVARFTHALESVLDGLRSRTIAYESHLAGLLLDSIAVVKGLLGAARGGSPAPSNWHALRQDLEQIAQQRKKAGVATPSSVAREPETRAVDITFIPHEDMMKSGLDPLLLVRDLAEAGEVVVLELVTTQLPGLAELDPECCYLSWHVQLSTSKTDAELADVFSFAEGRCGLSVLDVTAPDSTPLSAPLAAPAARESSVPPPATAAAVASAQTIRVATEKLDKLLDLVGELVISQAMIMEALRTRAEGDDTQVREALAAMDRNTRELQEGVMAIRMVPLATVFRRLPRMVRDLSVACGKKVRLDIHGEGTEIDKGMVEQLVDPLTHLVRNAIDHALEPPEERRAAQKAEEGKITIEALHQGGNVVISVSDDGRGLPTEKIRAKALERGLVAADATLSDEQIHDLIFHPGFSTADKVSDVSGRGVGMDVVKRNVESLKGSLLLSTQRGRGTQMKLRLPLTLAILDGLSVRVGQEIFILPIFSVVESFRPRPDQVRGVFGLRDVIDVRGVSLPIVRLHRVLGVPDAIEDPCRALVCVVEANGQSVALLVDEVVGQQQVVVKSLERNYRRIEAIMGATILGDGRVAMILDVSYLARVTSPGLSPADGAPRSPTAQPEISWTA